MRWATGKSSVEMNERTSSNSAGSLLVVAELEIRMFPYSRNHIKYELVFNNTINRHGTTKHRQMRRNS